MRESPHAVVAAHGLVRRFDPSTLALDDVDLTADAGTFTAIVGASGSGKSTLLHVLAGLEEPDAGQVRLLDHLLTGSSDEEAATVRRQHMGFVFQGFNLIPRLSAIENIRLPGRLSRSPRPVDLDWESHLVDVLGLRDLLGRAPAELAGGQQQRVAIARALSHRPAVVFADEPTGSLDLATGLDVLDLFGGLVREAGTCVLMVTHDPTAAATADRVVILRDGRIVDDGPSGSPPELASRMLAGARR